MAAQTRHLASALGPHSDYFYDKQFGNGQSGRRNRKKEAQQLSKRVRAHLKRETRSVSFDERD